MYLTEKILFWTYTKTIQYLLLKNMLCVSFNQTIKIPTAFETVEWNSLILNIYKLKIEHSCFQIEKNKGLKMLNN
jgi:hypothetical protein